MYGNGGRRKVHELSFCGGSNDRHGTVLVTSHQLLEK